MRPNLRSDVPLGNSLTGLGKVGPVGVASAPMSIQKSRSRTFRSIAQAALLCGLLTSPAHASNVMLAGAGSEKVHSTNIFLMQKGDTSVVTIHPDYEGPLRAFAVIVPVPKDVTKDRITTLKREYGDRVAQVSAPKFAEFWEMDPCDTETPHEQEWERDRSVKDDTGFLGTVKTDASKKVAKEMLLDVEAKQKAGEYKEIFIGGADEVKKWLADKDYKLPAGGEESIAQYAGAGYNFLALDVDVNRMELVGSDRASLSPVRFWTKEPSRKLPTRFGLPSAAPKQELHLFTLVPEQRLQVTNYTTKATPTNLSVVREYVEPGGRNVNLKERVGEFYAALHDRFLEKNPNTVLLEYAWPTATCGKPCPTEPLLPHELLSLGGDVFEAQLPEEVQHPEPPEATEEEKAKLEANLEVLKTPAEKKEAKETWEADRKELAARKGLIERNQYILSRLHYRYDEKGMPKDIELGEGAPIAGGNALPQGEHGSADTTVTPGGKNEFQTRFNGLFPNIKVVNCDNPKPHRWGKAPREYRGLNKIWVAEDLSRRDRKRIDPDKAVVTPIPDLGIVGLLAKAKEEKPVEATEEKKEDDGFCAYSPSHRSGSSAWWALLSLLATVGLGRRRRNAV